MVMDVRGRAKKTNGGTGDDDASDTEAGADGGDN